MNRNVLIGIVAVVLVLAGLGAYMAFGRGNNKPATSSTAQSTTPSGNSVVEGSIQSLLGAGKNVTCDVTNTDQKGSGTIYVNGGSFRGDFNTTTDGTVYVSHMISDGTTAYVWTDNSTQGTKMNVAETKKAAASGSTQTKDQAADLNANVNMKCSGWTVDNSKLTPPANVKFTDISTLINTTTPAQGGNSGTKPNTSYCDAVTDPQAKAACISATSGN